MVNALSPVFDSQQISLISVGLIFQYEDNLGQALYPENDQYFLGRTCVHLRLIAEKRIYDVAAGGEEKRWKWEELQL